MGMQLQDRSNAGGDFVPPPVAAERRRDERHVTVLQVAKLVTARCEELCIVRDISSGGLKAEVYCRLTVGDAVRIQFKSGHEVSGRVAWVDAHHIGMAFDAAVDIETLLLRRERGLDGKPLRAPRLRIDIPAALRIAGEQLSIQLCDISQDGCKVRSHRLLRPGSGCEIALPLLGYRLASVRWARDGHAGIMLHERLSYPDFAHWRHRLGSIGL
ncbi:MAG: PilZ domain-containing protein [Sphingomonas sp.]